MVQADPGSIKKSLPDRRSRLLDAAIMEFSQHGMAGARVDSIAKAAGANKQLLYHYFGDKAQLAREVITAVIRRQDEQEALYPKSVSLGDFIAIRCLRRIRRPLGRLWGRMLAWEALEQGADGIVNFDERRASVDVNFVAKVRESQDSGEIDPTFDAPMLALALMAIELIPSTLPNVTRIMTGFKGDEVEFTDRFIATAKELISRLAPDGSLLADLPDSGAEREAN